MDENNEKQVSQQKAIELAMKPKPTAGELADDDLDGVAGGTVLTGGEIYMMFCKTCGWRAFTDYKGDYDNSILALDHMKNNEVCSGSFGGVLV